MHTYATNSPFQPRLIALITFIAIAVTIGIGWLATWIKAEWGFQIGGVSSMAVFGVLYFIFDRWLWKMGPLRRMLLVPNLNGRWQCHGHTVRRNGDPADDDWNAEVIITQSWSRINVVLKTGQSSSRSMAASLYFEAGEGYRLIYHYRNDPKVNQNNLHKHEGTCRLTFDNRLQEAEGSYYTDIDRLTVGTMKLTKLGSVT